jgi:hypothetical protein
MATLATHAADPVTIDGRRCAEEDATKVLGKRLNSIPDKVHETRRYALGVYCGLTFGIVLNPIGAPDAFLEGETTRHGPLSRDAGPRAVLNALDRLADSYASQCGTARQELAIAEAQLRDHKARFGAPFAHGAYLAELTTLRDQLKAGLSGATPESGADALPPAAETAERIKALKSAHTIEPAPQRLSARSAATAEEPVTTRIRRLTGFVPAIESSAEATPAASPAEIPSTDVTTPAHREEPTPLAVIHPFPETMPTAPAVPQTAYRQHVGLTRRQNDRQLSLF